LPGVRQDRRRRGEEQEPQPLRPRPLQGLRQRRTPKHRQEVVRQDVQPEPRRVRPEQVSGVKSSLWGMRLTPVAASGVMPSAPKPSSRARAALPKGAEGSLRGSPGTACHGDAACTQSKERRKERSLDFADAPLGMTLSRGCLTVQAPRLRRTAALPRGPRTQKLESSP
jgi:hypothetical protein